MVDTPGHQGVQPTGMAPVFLPLDRHLDVHLPRDIRWRTASLTSFSQGQILGDRQRPKENGC
jgi:hypothetical protein